jgi:calcium-translocating P-type ATPase
MADGDAAHALAGEEVARRLGSDPERGLTEAEACARLERVGPNALPRRSRPDYAGIAGRQLGDPLVLLLMAAAVLSVMIGEAVDAGVIAAIVLVNGVLGFVQEVGADRAVLALRDTLEPRARAVRDGREREVAAEQLVPGDLLVLREGERVAADGRIVGAEGLAVDESLLTGESVPVDKTTRSVAVGAPLAERLSLVFAGTGVTRGRGRAVVVATGAAAQVGRVAALTAEARPPPTPLQRRLAGLTRAMVAVGVLITLGLTAADLARGAELQDAFLLGVSVAVAAVPEGLAATVTIALALGARRMAARGAIVRRLGAVETLGSASVIASDKTGTLTQNRLALHSVAPVAPHTEGDVLAAAVRAGAAELVQDGGAVRAVGDPLDAAILLAARERGVAGPAGAVPLRELSFDANRKRMTTVHREAEGLHAYTKGAPETVLARCRAQDATRAAELAALAERCSGQGLRVLAVAGRSIPAADTAVEELERELEPLGLVALHDPLRASAPAAVAQARAAGIGVQILTGDHPATAAAIARRLDLPAETVAARVTPEDKLRLVERLQASGEVVAVTGDGVNDAPALRRADVGVAMGQSGTEAAREAADVVLTDDDFATILAAVREGRAIADNVRKFVAFLLSANLGEVVLFAVAVLAGLGPPMTVVQILLVNVLTDGLPAVALAADPPLPQLMNRPPERPDRLFHTGGWAAMIAVGAAVGACALASFLIGRELPGAPAQTMAFATVALGELIVVFAVRSPLQPAWAQGPNRWLIGGVLASTAVLAAAIYARPLHAPLGTVTLNPAPLAVAATLAVVPAVVVEGGKALLRRAAPGRATKALRMVR